MDIPLHLTSYIRTKEYRQREQIPRTEELMIDVAYGRVGPYEPHVSVPDPYAAVRAMAWWN